VELVHYDIVLGAVATYLETILDKLTAEDKAAWKRVLDVIKHIAVGEYEKAGIKPK
jgi:hypothetical protein